MLQHGRVPSESFDIGKEWPNLSAEDWNEFLHGWDRIAPPKNFCLDQNYDEVASFFEALRDYFFRRSSVNPLGRRKAYVDFREIEHISPSAALVLAAEFHRVYSLTNSPRFPVDLPNWKPEVRKILDELGFLKLLGVMDPTSKYEDQGVQTYKILKFRSGSNTNSQAAAEMRDALRDLFQHLEEAQWLACYDCLIEAMGNVVSHAYPKRNRSRLFEYPVLARWWVTGSVDPVANRMSIVFFDQGLTIPRALPRTKFGEHVMAHLNKALNVFGFDQVDDGELIDAAMEVSRTSTGKSERGLGLGQMRGLVERGNDGHMRIISRRGDYQYQRSKVKADVLNRKNGIGGTLIEWELMR